MKRMSSKFISMAFCFVISPIFLGAAVIPETCVAQHNNDSTYTGGIIGGSYTYNMAYETIRCLSKESFWTKKQLEREFESFINVFKNEMALLVADYEQLPFTFTPADFSEDQPLMYVTISIIMEEEPETGCLHPQNQCGFNVAIDAERALTEFATEYTAFSVKARAIILAGCHRLVQLLKHYEDVLVFEAGKPAIVLDISVHLDQETIEKLVGEKK